jgi:predicted nucleic acid-binding Zn ribbon protein
VSSDPDRLRGSADDPDRPPGTEEQPPTEGPDPTPEAPSTETSGVDLARAALARARAAARDTARTGGAQARHDGSGSSGARWRRRPRTDPGLRSGARPDDRDPQMLSSAIGRLLSERGWETDAAVAGVLGRWDVLVGPEMAAHCRPDRFSDGVLTVLTDSTAWATQVRLLAPQLLKRLNERLGHGTVQRVQVRGPEAPSWGRGPRRVRGQRGPRDTYG